MAAIRPCSGERASPGWRSLAALLVAVAGGLAVASAAGGPPVGTVVTMGSETVFWEGRGKSTPLFNFDGSVFWEGRGKTKAIANVRGRVVWRGRSVLTAILSADDRNTAWQGTGRSKALFSIDEHGVVWEGRGRTKALANLDGRTIWEGRGRSRALANWDGDRFGDPALLAALWFLLETPR